MVNLQISTQLPYEALEINYCVKRSHYHNNIIGCLPTNINWIIIGLDNKKQKRRSS